MRQSFAMMDKYYIVKAITSERRQNIQYAIIALGIIIFIILFLLFSRSIVANQKLISFFGVLGLLVVFEFVNLLIHSWLVICYISNIFW
jgi:hypothetical protein